MSICYRMLMKWVKNSGGIEQLKMYTPNIQSSPVITKL